MTTTTTNENELGTFYGLTVAHPLWTTLGAKVQAYSNDTQAQIDWGAGWEGDRRKAYAIELLERSKAVGNISPNDIVRGAIVLYGADRSARAQQDIASAIRDFAQILERKQFAVSITGLNGLTDALRQLTRK